VTHEDPVLDHDAVADERVALDLAAAPDLGAALDLYERPDPGAVADGAAVQVGEGEDDDALAEADVVDQAVGSLVGGLAGQLTTLGAAAPARRA
jgi:hypothetical protein